MAFMRFLNYKNIVYVSKYRNGSFEYYSEQERGIQRKSYIVPKQNKAQDKSLSKNNNNKEIEAQCVPYA